MSGNGQELWIPGRELAYEAYDNRALLADWRQHYYDGPDLDSVSDECMGVMRLPADLPERLVSVDLCEVVRQTHLATARVMGHEEADLPHTVWTYEQLPAAGPDIVTMVKAVMNADLVEPVKDIASIRHHLRRWRQAGAYVVANTSTLPNCETATIRHLLARELPECFDAIVLPRNHFGDGQMTKGLALKQVADKLRDHAPGTIARAVHIDDAPHHLAAVAAVAADIAERTALFMPTYQPGARAPFRPPVETHQEVVTVDGPLAAFQAADEFLFK